ncbi:MAG TPA: hypothetical protein VEF03_03455 [Candidatus Binataceae bacterium]|nr:hypothetical protein [Candidatus Binataceae bacterium]
MKNIGIRRVSNYGTSHPVVARLRLQSLELIRWACLPVEKQKRAIQIYDSLKNRLLKCHECNVRLETAAKDALSSSLGFAGANVRPHLIGLEQEAETFLYESKNYLRDLLGVFNVFFGTKFDEASDFCSNMGKGRRKVTEWASERFGPKDRFTKMLQEEEPWIRELICKRNAVEHPRGKSGVLKIDNFQQMPDGRMAPPSWARDQQPPTDVLGDLRIAMDNMLTLAEDILVACIENTTDFPIEFTSIPEKERSAACPIRITVQMKKRDTVS